MGFDGIMDNYPINRLNGFKWAINHHHGHIYISPAIKKGDATMEMSGTFLGKIWELYVAGTNSGAFFGRTFKLWD
jgi:hypothetical protein